uniref:FkbM family methyltransferase n=1 Tax=candidate division CPR3 bacterium TaxID=2268181 RepID=A0A7V3N4B4_UNCC3
MQFNWLPLKSQIGRIIKICLPSGMIVPIFQGTLRGKKWMIASSNIECALGSYEYEKRKLFENRISKGSVVYDVGAHVGFYTLLASEIVGPEGKVIAFEPVPQNLLFLRRHLQLNGCRNVTIVDAAVCDKEGIACFDRGPNSSMGHISKDGDLIVRLVSLDELVMKNRIDPPDYIKIDVEGAELLVLKGAKKTLTKYKPELFLATHSPELHRNCCMFLRSLGCQIRPIANERMNLSDELFGFWPKSLQ